MSGYIPETVWECKGCGKFGHGNQDRPFCAYCGMPQSTVVVHKCRTCGKDVLSQDKFCQVCGQMTTSTENEAVANLLRKENDDFYYGAAVGFVGAITLLFVTAAMICNGKER